MQETSKLYMQFPLSPSGRGSRLFLSDQFPLRARETLERDKRHPLSVVRSNTVWDHMVPGSCFSDWVKTPHTAAKVLNQD